MIKCKNCNREGEHARWCIVRKKWKNRVRYKRQQLYKTFAKYPNPYQWQYKRLKALQAYEIQRPLTASIEGLIPIEGSTSKIILKCAWCEEKVNIQAKPKQRLKSHYNLSLIHI